jgi:hypothetical protein
MGFIPAKAALFPSKKQHVGGNKTTAGAVVAKGQLKCI